MNQLGKKKSDYNKIILGGSKSMYFVTHIFFWLSLSLSLKNSSMLVDNFQDITVYNDARYVQFLLHLPQMVAP